MAQLDILARHRHHQYLTAMLKASHAARLMRKGWPDDAAARRCGYGDVSSMRKAIKKYLHQKSPAPAPTGNEADQNIHHQNTTKEADCQ